MYKSLHLTHWYRQHSCAEFLLELLVWHETSLSVLFPQLHFSPVTGSHVSP